MASGAANPPVARRAAHGLGAKFLAAVLLAHLCLLACTASVSARENPPSPPLTFKDVPGDGEYGKADLRKVRIYLKGNAFNVEASVYGLGRGDEITLSLNSSDGDYVYVNQSSMGDRQGVYAGCKVTVKSGRRVTLSVPASCLPKFTKNKTVTAVVHLLEGPIYPEKAYVIIDSLYTDGFVIPRR